MRQADDPRLAEGRWLRIPGPTPVPPAVLSAMSLPMIPHRGREMTHMIESIRSGLQEVFRTDGEVMVWSGSGSSGWEAAIQNTCSPGDTVVATVSGNFGKRFADVAEKFDLHVVRVEVTWGEAVTADQMAAALAGAGDVRAVLVTHNETSTGVTNPLKDIAAVADRAGALVLVDAVSSAAAIPLETDEWGLDWVISGSQKAWMCPPGLMLAAVSERAIAAAADVSVPRFFWDVERMASGFRTGQAPTTPAIPLLRALDVALRMMLEEGVDAIWKRHVNLGRLVREVLMQAGLTLHADERFVSDSLTAFRSPDQVKAGNMRDMIRDDSGVEIALGQGSESDAVLRVGHMGWAHEPELMATLESIGRVVKTLD